MSDLILPPGFGNSAKVVNTDVDVHELKAVQAKDMLRQVSELLKPYGNNPLGSAVVFYYVERQNGVQDVYNLVQQLNIQKVPEGLADFGWKQLGESLMKSFGHAPKRRRK